MADILIAGAGLGGLTVALALIQRGHDVRVFEQAAELREFAILNGASRRLSRDPAGCGPRGRQERDPHRQRVEQTADL